MNKFTFLPGKEVSALPVSIPMVGNNEKQSYARGFAVLQGSCALRFAVPRVVGFPALRTAFLLHPFSGASGPRIVPAAGGSGADKIMSDSFQIRNNLATLSPLSNGKLL